ncbi:MAG: hypothetical protein J6U19_07325 [Oscillospiraceae bacterium]|nr:hypothetical protein [Oscillospiraceae bacterium]
MDSKHDSGQCSPVFSLLPHLYRLVLTSREHKEYGLTKMQMLILNALVSCDVLTMTQISEFISTSKEQATRTVSALVNMGIVERIVPDNNRTRVEIRLTDKGAEFMRDYYSNAEQRIRGHVRAYLTEEEITQLRESLGTAVNLLLKIKK